MQQMHSCTGKERDEAKAAAQSKQLPALVMASSCSSAAWKPTISLDGCLHTVSFC
jgi:hypothetical protein